MYNNDITEPHLKRKCVIQGILGGAPRKMTTLRYEYNLATKVSRWPFISEISEIKHVVSLSRICYIRSCLLNTCTYYLWSWFCVVNIAYILHD